MSLKYRIAATIFGLEIVLIGAVLWMTLGHSMATIHEQIARTEAVTLQLLGDLSRAALLTDEYTNLQTFIEGTKRDPRVQAVIIGDASGRVVAATDLGLIGLPLPVLVADEHRYWRRAAIRGHGSALGALAIKFSDFPLVLAYRETRNLGITIAITGMAAIAVVGLAMGFFLTRRLAKLATAADRVAGGELSVRVDVDGAGRGRPGRPRLQQHGRAAGRQPRRAAGRARPPGAADRGDVGRLRDLGRRRPSGAVQQQAAGVLPSAGQPTSRSASTSRTSAAPCTSTCSRRTPTWRRSRPGSRTGSRIGACSLGPWEMHLRDGRWLAVSEFGTLDGGTIGIYSDITEGKRRQQALEQGEQRLRAIMDAVIDGIVTVAGDGTVESANPAAARIFGCSADELVGRAIHELLVDPGVRDGEAGLGAALGRSRRAASPRSARDGRAARAMARAFQSSSR